MKTIPWLGLFAWLLAAFFALGGTLNILASPEIVADYRRWGYPDGFNYLTGALEWSTALLVALHRTRLWGSLLGAAVMAAAAVTVLVHGEVPHAVPPLTVLALSLLLAALVLRRRRRAAAAE